MEIQGKVLCWQRMMIRTSWICSDLVVYILPLGKTE